MVKGHSFLEAMNGRTGSMSPDPADKKFDYWTPLLMSTIAGLSTTLGGLVVYLFRDKPSNAAMAFTYALAAGVMVTVTIIELWGPALFSGTHQLQTILMSSLGMLVYYVFTKMIPDMPLDDSKEEVHLRPPVSQGPRPGDGLEESSDDKAKLRRARKWRLACLMMMVLTMHNFPEGLAVAISAVHEPRLGFVIMIAIGMHNIPEGIAIAVPTYDSTGSKRYAVWMSFLSGLTEPLGAIFALTLLRSYLTSSVIEALLAFVGGMMFAVAAFELMPESSQYKKTCSQVAGFGVGCLVMGITCLVV